MFLSGYYTRGAVGGSNQIQGRGQIRFKGVEGRRTRHKGGGETRFEGGGKTDAKEGRSIKIKRGEPDPKGGS